MTNHKNETPLHKTS